MPVRLDPDWPPPSSPLPVGGGAVHADLIDDDHDALARLRTALRDDERPVDAERLAAEAQQWRLPVTPYRAPSPTWPGLDGWRTPRPPSAPAAVGARALPVVVDLSALWAGPLATSLLARLGATVVKIDGPARPDGLGERPAVYRHLNAGKRIEALDLRRTPDRRRFEELLANADLVVDSFSRRVLPNLGYPHQELLTRFPRLRSLSIVAFPIGTPEADWVAYGPGVHACSGLGHRGHDRPPRPAAIAYPDALAGFEAFAAASAMLSGGGAERRREISLAGALAPLVARRLDEEAS